MGSLRMYDSVPGLFRWFGGRCGQNAAACGLAGGLICAAGWGAAQPTKPPIGAEGPAAMVAGQPIDWSDLRPRLAEAAGATVLEEAVLDRLVEGEFRVKGRSLTGADIEHEGALLSEAMARTAGAASGDERQRLIDAVRRSRGLGDVRYAAMLKRNAMLRALTQDEVKVSDDDVALAFQIRHGPRARVRIIVTADQAQAASARKRVTDDGEPFAEVASAVSTDPSKYRGGLMEPLSTADPTYPAAFRRATADLKPTEVSQPVAVDGGFAVIRLEEVLPADGTKEREVREDLRSEVRLVRERVAMDRLAARLLADNRVTVLDGALNWSWEGRNRTGTP